MASTACRFSSGAKAGRLSLMRTFSALAAAAVLLALGSAACAARVVPVPVITVPAFPDFLPPDVPPELAGTKAAGHQDRAWRFLQTGDLRNAEREIGFALLEAQDFYPTLTTAGYLRLARDEAEAALVEFDRALALRAGYTPALAGRGHALLALERESDAIAAFEAAYATDPSLGELRRRVEVLRFRGLQRDLAAARAEAQAGRSEEAVRLYQSALSASPDSAILYRELAAVERELGQADLALEHFRRAVSLDPYDAASRAAIGDLLEQQGDLEAALGAYEEAVAIEPGGTIEAKRDALRARVEFLRMPEEYRAIESLAQVTRADLAALIGVRLAPAIEGAATQDAVVITDVRSSWAEPWILAVANAGVMEPYDNHTFQPSAIVRRVDLADAVSRLLRRTVSPERLRAWQSADISFADLPPAHLAYPAASLSVASGVMTAAAEGFEASLPVSGTEALAAVERLREVTGGPGDPAAGGR
jgi:tetratricopeptide (TPR) repeat protein